MSLLALSRNVPKGLSSIITSSGIITRNGVNFTKIVGKKQFNSLNNLQKREKQLLKLVVRETSPVRNSSTTGDHRLIWTTERAISLLLIGLIPYDIISPSLFADNLVALATTAHIHWGLEAIVIDYVRPVIFGPVIPKFSLLALYVLSAATLGGLLYYNYSNIGIGKTIHKIWRPKEA